MSLFTIRPTLFEGNLARRNFHNKINEESKSMAFKHALDRKNSLEEITKRLDELYLTSEDAREVMRLIAERNTLLTMLRSAEEVHENGMLGEFKP